MTGPSLGRIASVVPREVWPHEAHDFTPWLLDNVDVLSELLGMDLALEAAEHPVGDFSLDLIGRDEATGERVIVENQLEQSDHTHLGQIITYAAGTDPTTIVWVTTGFRPEHRAAIDWLNQRTDDNTRVFGVLIKVVRIGDSLPAPAFELVAQPNDWEKQVRAAAAPAGVVSARTALYAQFWEQVLDRIRAEHPTWTSARRTNQQFCNTKLVSEVPLTMVWRSTGLSTQIYFDSRDAGLNEARFDALFTHRETFEVALGQEAVWDRMNGFKGARVILPADEFEDVSQTDLWPRMTDWLIEAQIKMRYAFDAVGGPTLMNIAPPLSYPGEPIDG
jgi:hypothetical protein